MRIHMMLSEMNVVIVSDYIGIHKYIFEDGSAGCVRIITKARLYELHHSGPSRPHHGIRHSLLPISHISHVLHDSGHVRLTVLRRREVITEKMRIFRSSPAKLNIFQVQVVLDALNYDVAALIIRDRENSEFLLFSLRQNS